MFEVPMDDTNDQLALAYEEQEQIGMETLDRLLAAGAREDDVKYIAWMAGLVKWEPRV